MTGMVKNIVSTFSLPSGLRLIFAALFCVAVLCGCGSGDSISKGIKSRENDNGNNNHPIAGKPEGLSAETASRIRQDYFNYERNKDFALWTGYTVDDFLITDYYGTYNNCVVLKMSIRGLGGLEEGKWPSIKGVSTSIIGETLFWHDHNPFFAWTEGLIYELGDAYDQGLLTVDNMRSIAYYFWDGEELNLENHAGLLDLIQVSIKNKYFYTYIEPYFPEAFGNTYVQIENYYGYYKNFADVGGPFEYIPFVNDCVAVMMNSNYDEYSDDAWEETVAGVLFSYNNGNRILLWKIEYSDWSFPELVPFVGRFYELQEAYDLGFLTEDDIKSIAYYHETGETISY